MPETTTEPLRAYHGEQPTKDVLLANIGAHEKADAIVQGTYGRKANGHYERCAVGCSVHSAATVEQRTTDDLHALYPELFGLPTWLAHLEDKIFEGLPKEKAAEWPRRFAEAIPVGADFDGLADRLAICRLKEECLPLSGQWPESIRGEVVAAIEKVIAALEGKQNVSAARSAAESAAESAARSAWSAARSAAESAAESAARSAARSARSAAESARSAARSARSAAESARSAAESARSAARSAAFDREADRLIAELEALPVPAGATA
jgi:hypothetical protein